MKDGFHVSGKHINYIENGKKLPGPDLLALPAKTLEKDTSGALNAGTNCPHISAFTDQPATSPSACMYPKYVSPYRKTIFLFRY